MAVTLFPQPDSPTMPSVSPGKSSKLTLRTALTSPSSVKKDVLRFLTSRIGRLNQLPPTAVRLASALLSGVECVPQPVAEEVERQEGERQRERREDDDVSSALQQAERSGAIARAAGDAAPGEQRWPDAEAQEAEERLREDRDGDDECRLHDDWPQRVWKDVREQHARTGGAARASCSDVLTLADAECLPAHEPSHVHPGRRGYGDHDVDQAGSQDDVEDEREQQCRDAVEHIDHRADHVVYPASRVPREHPEGDADQQDDQRRTHADDEGDLRSLHHLAEKVAVERVAAERVRRARSVGEDRLHRACVLRLGIVGRPHEAHECHNDDEDEIERSGQGELVAAEASQPVPPQAHLLAREDATLVLGAQRGEDRGHQYRILGSMVAYARSTKRLAMPIIAAYSVKHATATL